jgi:hypothetical protein
MTVRQFIIDNGIEALNGKIVTHRDSGTIHSIKLRQLDVDDFDAKLYRLSALSTDEHGEYEAFIELSRDLNEEVAELPEIFQQAFIKQQ